MQFRLQTFWQKENTKSLVLRHRWSRQKTLAWELRLHMGPGGCPLIEYKESSSCRPPTWKQLWAFLGLTGYCRIWIPNYGLIAQPLYESLKGDDSIPLMWETPQKKAEATLKQALNQAPALRLPDPEKAFQLYVHKREGIALGVLTQRLGSKPQPVAYLSKRLDPTAWGWPPPPSKSCSYCNHDRRCFKTLVWGQTNYFLPATK